QRLDRIEAEDADGGEAAHRPAVVGGPESMGGVVHDAQAPLVGQGGGGVVVAEVGPVVHEDDRPGGRPDQLGGPVDVDAQGHGVDVAEHRLGPGGHDRLDVGQMGEGGDDDLRPGAGASDQHGQVEGGVAG